MKRTSYIYVIMGTVLFSASALADEHDSFIHNLPDNGEVTLSGTVDKAGQGDEFTLSTEKGDIIVNLPHDKSTVLKTGDNVTVKGVVKKPLLGVLGNELQASSVEVNRHPL